MYHDPMDKIIGRHNEQDRGYTSACWIWSGYTMKNGYGSRSVGGKGVLAHRAYYEHFVAPIPEGLTIDHLCSVRCCVNPDHLEAVTMRENVLRSQGAPTAINARRTHCVNGHEFTPENTYIRKGRVHGGRSCRQCASDRRIAKRQKELDRPEDFAAALEARRAYHREYDATRRKSRNAITRNNGAMRAE